MILSGWLMAHLDFKLDLDNAKITEEIAARLLHICADQEFMVEWNDDNRYDFACNLAGENVKIEVKDDIGSMNTPNVFVEFHCRGKPSGIEVTESTHHIYKIYDSPVASAFYLIATDTLRDIIDKQLYHRIACDAGDIGSQTKGYLFAKDVIVGKSELIATERKNIKLEGGKVLEKVRYYVNGEKFGKIV